MWPQISQDGYIQRSQVDPFGVRMYTETGIWKKTPLTLYLDAADMLHQRFLIRPKDSFTALSPFLETIRMPLPSQSMLTSEHIPATIFWLLCKLSQYTKLRVHQYSVVCTAPAWSRRPLVVDVNIMVLHCKSQVIECFSKLKFPKFKSIFICCIGSSMISKCLTFKLTMHQY